MLLVMPFKMVLLWLAPSLMNIQMMEHARIFTVSQSGGSGGRTTWLSALPL